MAIFTAAELAEQKAAWKGALLACAANQSYEIEGRTLTRANLPEIRATLDWLNDQTSAEDTAAGLGGPRFTPLAPRRPK